MADDKTKTPPTPDEKAEEAPKHPMSALFERIGLKAGAQLRVIRSISGGYLNDVEVVEVVACLDPFEVALILRESGTQITQVWRYANVASFSVR